MFRTGPHAAAVEALQTYLPVAPDMLAVECANAVSTMVRAGALGVDDAQSVLDGLLAPVTLRNSRGILGDALAISLRAGHPLYDCLYVAVAATLDVAVVTADKRFAKAFADDPAVTIIDLHSWAARP